MAVLTPSGGILTPSGGELRAYQRRMFEFSLQRRASAWWADPGLGKTMAALALIDELAVERGEIGRTLIVAPKFGVELTWPDEARKWGYPEVSVLDTALFERGIHEVGGLEVKAITNAREVRKSLRDRFGLLTAISYENFPWLVKLFPNAWPFDALILDESQMVKSVSSLRHLAAAHAAKRSKRVLQLTGTPMPNRVGDLYGQMKLLDGGKAIGRTKSQFNQLWCRPEFGSGPRPRYVPLADAYDRMAPMLSHLAVSFLEEDWLELPELVVNDIWVNVPEAVSRLDDMVRESRLLMGEPLASAGVAVGKRLQIASGAVYDADGNVHLLHDAKLDALETLISRPLIVLYQFDHEADRIERRFGAKVRRVDTDSLRAWNRGEVQILLAHPEQIARSLNLQSGGSQLAWFSPTYNAEWIRQMIKRIHRSGQTASHVTMHRLLARGTLDGRVVDVAEQKIDEEDALRRLVEARRL